MGFHLTAQDTIVGGIDTVTLFGNYFITLSDTTLQDVSYLVLAAGGGYAITTAEGTVAAGATMTVDGSALGADDLHFEGSAETDGHFILKGGTSDDEFHSGLLADTITSGGGSDTFYYAGGAESSSTWHDTITDLAAGTDFFEIDGSSILAVYAVSGSVSAASFDSDLAALAAMHFRGATVIAVTGGDLAGHTLLMADADGNATYDAGSDYVFDITGYTGTITTADFS